MPSEKNAGKAIDAVRADDAPPESTSRPVLITNRPILVTDPMLSADSGSHDETAERPSNEPVDQSGAEPKILRGAKTMVPKPVASETEGPASAFSATQADAIQPESQKDAQKSQSPTEKKIRLEPLPKATATAEDSPAASTDPKKDVSPLRQQQRSETDRSEDAGKSQDFEIERHIAAGTFFVPIGQANRRRMKLVFLLILVLCAVLIALDILLDLQILTFQGIPHTDFL